MKKIKYKLKVGINKLLSMANAIVLMALVFMPLLANISFADNTELGTDLGEYNITTYCEVCNSGAPRSTATANVEAEEHHTAAIDVLGDPTPNGLQMGDKFRIGNEVYTVYDKGYGPGGKDVADKWVDLFVSSSECGVDCGGSGDTYPSKAHIYKLTDEEAAKLENSNNNNTDGKSDEDIVEELNLLSLVEIAGGETTGYYVKFVDDIDERLQVLINENPDLYYTYDLNKARLKKMIKGALATKLPDLGGAPFTSSVQEEEDDVEVREVSEEVLEKIRQAKAAASKGGSGTSFSTIDGFLFIGDSITNRFRLQGVVDSDVTLRSCSSTNASDWLKNDTNVYKEYGTKQGLNESLHGLNGIKGINIMLGTNGQANLTELKTLIQQLHEEYNVPIFVDEILPIKGVSDTRVKNYNDSLYDLGFNYVNVIDVSGPGTVQLEDGIHPDATNAKILFNNIKEKILSGTGVASNIGGSTGWEWPVAIHQTANERGEAITSPYGPRNLDIPGSSKFHEGLDIACGYREKIIASGDGTVEVAGDYGGLGKCVVINHGTINGEQIKTYYGHNDEVIVSVGDHVTQGQQIAYADHTGISGGDHCHFQFEVDGKRIDPLNAFSAEQVNGGGYVGTGQYAGSVSGNTLESGIRIPMGDPTDNFIIKKRANRFYDSNSFNGAVTITRVSPNKNPGDLSEDFVKDKDVNIDRGSLENRGKAYDVPENIKNLLYSASLKGKEDYDFSQFKYLRIPYLNFDGDIIEGDMIVKAELAEEVLDIFYDLYSIKYPIQNLKVIDRYYEQSKTITSRGEYNAREETQIAKTDNGGGSGNSNVIYPSPIGPQPTASIDPTRIQGTTNLLRTSELANNSYSYYIEEGGQHALGVAIDINPYINPMMEGNTPKSETEDKFLNREPDDFSDENEKNALITKNSKIVSIFKKYGWKWGGEDESNPDYKHFYKEEEESEEDEEETQTTTETEEELNNNKIVVLDPGHGGDLNESNFQSNGFIQNSSGDWGEYRHWKTGTYGEECNGSGCNGNNNAGNGSGEWYHAENGERDAEPEINLANAMAAKKYLEEMGYTVRMTRTSDSEHPSFAKRSEYCFPNNDTSQNPDAELYVCIHSNAGGGSGAAYISTESGHYDQKYIDQSTYSSDSNKAGETIINKITEQTSLGKYSGGTIDGQPDMIAFHKNTCPTAYLEIGFFDNDSDLGILNSESDQIGKAIAEGIDEYFGHPEARKSKTETTKTVSTRDAVMETKVNELVYVPQATFNKLISQNDERVLNVFTLDTNFNVIVATWNYTDGELKFSQGSKVEYKKPLQKYSMPYEFLIAITVNTKDSMFAADLAMMALNCKYIVAVEDEVTTIRTVTTTTVVTVGVTGTAGEEDEVVRNTSTSSETMITERASQKTEINYVDSWFVKYVKDINFADVPPEGTIMEIPGSVTTTTTQTDNTFDQRNERGIGQIITKHSDSLSKKYSFDTGNDHIGGNASKFLELYNNEKYKAKRNIYIPWLENALEKYNTTVNLIDVIKYLVYQGRDYENYGLSYLMFSEWAPGEFSAGGNYGDDFGDWDGTGTNDEFIELVAKYAIYDYIVHDTKILPSVTIAQAIVESGWGKDSIAIKYKNFFGMKAFTKTPNEYWNGESVLLNASEGGQDYFKVYDSLKNSVYDHGRNFHVTETYGSHGVLDDGLDCHEQLRRIAESGYATDRNGNITVVDGLRYDEYIYQRIVKPYNLERFDTMTLADIGSNGQSPGASKNAQKVIDAAKSKIGCDYVWGSKGPNTFDCSGLVYWAFQQIRVTVPDCTSAYRPYVGKSQEVKSWDDAQPGDILLLFRSDGSGHAAIYLGNDEYIHAPYAGEKVKISKGARSYFSHIFRWT